MRSAAAALEREPEVVYAEPNYYRRIAAVPSDPRFGDLWALNNTGQSVGGAAGTADADIDAPEAWNITTGSAQMTVAVTDTGIAYDHPDLAPNIWANPGETGHGKETNGRDDDRNGLVDDWRGWDWVSDDNDPRDLSGHGTHVAGTIGARGNDGAGVAGVSWHVKLMPLQVADANGMTTDARLIPAFQYAAAKGARVVNVSIGGSKSSRAVSDAIAGAPRTLFVVAAGNGGDDGVGDDNDNDTTPNYPCVFKLANLVCVTATDQNDQLADFSNHGSKSVDLGAPGTNVLSTQPAYGSPLFSEGFETDITGRWTTGDTSNTWARTADAGDGFAFRDGTSMSAPHAAGVAALVFAKYPKAGVAGLKKALLKGVERKSSLAKKTVTGGRLNAYLALKAAARVATPRLKLTGATSQRGLRKGGVVISVRCERLCALVTSGKVSISGRAKALRMKKVTKALRGGRRTELKLRLSGRSLRAIRRALAGRRQVSATVIATVWDSEANSSSAKLSVGLKR